MALFIQLKKNYSGLFF